MAKIATFFISMKNSQSHRFITASTIILMLVLFSGFRPFPQSAESVVRGVESAFQVNSHAELYVMVRVEKNGEIHTDQWLLMYEYDDQDTRGVWRILPRYGHESTTLLSIQQPGKATKLFLKSGEDGALEEVDGMARRRAFGPSDWNMEDIYDDDKHDWSHRKIGSAMVRGVGTIVIESRYDDPTLRDQSIYSKRRVYLAKDNQRFLRSDYYDRTGTMVKTVNAAHHENVGSDDGVPRIRPRRLEIVDLQDGSMTVMVRVYSVFDEELPRELFSEEGVASWDASTDKKLIELLEKDS
ncbi:outer membrane lipoprotein-sorting protein [Rubellicoccus peritrichatus]|uniref:Outer membrane lipoprotein-sorting protein n=1 Tax=Rubellicoccus peritrichatus TaxID=3080537 RepID=A0AAQ3QUZ8_9BACT|nr:outer membrane lipoprotein-sorting protein [Puniceicoccus sp. CR14]WOO40983.1 outer membrane lipoprotein-sorting protein [Puniceicoccus sp. CR14]